MAWQPVTHTGKPYDVERAILDLLGVVSLRNVGWGYTLDEVCSELDDEYDRPDIRAAMTVLFDGGKVTRFYDTLHEVWIWALPTT